MRYLTDTHVLLWAFFCPEKLSDAIRKVLEDAKNAIYYSPINLWEISIKYGLKKLDLGGMTPEEFYAEIKNSYYICKEVCNNDIVTSYKLQRPEKLKYHKDPFDRFLIWEAMKNDFVLLSVDDSMKCYTKTGLKVLF
jgi:PIN domain nuclease of toxin-antitoxin system